MWRDVLGAHVCADAGAAGSKEADRGPHGAAVRAQHVQHGQQSMPPVHVEKLLEVVRNEALVEGRPALLQQQQRLLNKGVLALRGMLCMSRGGS
jgi:hypothetical protein